MALGSVWWRIAWRNLWRNPRRTLITAAALAFGFLASVLIIGISDGIVAEMVENVTEIVSGQVQIRSAEYLPERSLYETLGGDVGVDVHAVLDAIDRVEGVEGTAPRVYGGGLVSSGEETVAGTLMGVDLDRERGVSRILTALTEGDLPRPGARELMLGSEMARKLVAAVGSEVVLVAPAADGSMGNDLFVVAGIFRTGLPLLDGSQAIVPLGDLQELLALESGRIHEVVVGVRDPWTAPQTAARIEGEEWLVPDGVVEPWTRFRPELVEYALLVGSANGIIVGIVFAMAVFGVANTMLMATFERRREFAVVRALGTGPGSLARTVLYEGIVLGLLSLAVGAVLTTPLMMWLHRSPLDLSRVVGGFTMAGALVRPLLRVEYSLDGPLLSAAGLLLTSLLAALYPAYRAVRIPPADALAGR